ncbi:hypothetical protein VTO42DRAFT_1962 [Malbranchea cinnamomea]
MKEVEKALSKRGTRFQQYIERLKERVAKASDPENASNQQDTSTSSHTLWLLFSLRREASREMPASILTLSSRLTEPSPSPSRYISLRRLLRLMPLRLLLPRFLFPPPSAPSSALVMNASNGHELRDSLVLDSWYDSPCLQQAGALQELPLRGERLSASRRELV